MGIYKKGDNWYIDYYVNGRRKRENIGQNKKLAKIVLQKRKVEIAEGKYLDRKKEERIKFEDFAETFLELHSKLNKKPSSYARDKDLIKKLNLSFSGRYLYAISSQQVEEYKMKRAKEVKPATVNRELALLKCLYNKAIAWGKVSSNPVKGVRLFHEDNKRIRFLEKEEIEKLLRAIDRLSSKLNGKYRHLKPIVAVALNTGMRKGEILKLTWKDIDIIRRIIYIEDTKNRQRREVPMNDIVAKTLIAVPKHMESPYIFCGKNGKPFMNVRKSFDRALSECGIINFRFHDLRHTFASQLVMSGIDLKTVSELLGHKSMEMTLRYSHLSPSHKQRAVDILNRKLDTIWTPGPVVDEIEKVLLHVTTDDING